MWYFFSTWHLLGNRVSKTRFLNQKNLKKFEVSCKAEIPKNKYKKKTSIPILKTQIRGRERSEGEKDLDQRERDSGRGDPGRPKSRRSRHASLRLRRPRHVSLRPGSRTAWGSRHLGRPGARAPGRGDPNARAPGRGNPAREPQAWVARDLGLAQPGATRRASPRPGLRTVV